jgi:2-iminobutanoate/2-iminopropanoate deaminase
MDNQRSTDGPTQIVSPDAPRALGPYAQALAHGDLLFCSGQVPIDPKTGAICDGGIREMAERCLTNLAAVCAAAGTDLERALKVTIYLRDLGDFNEVNTVYGGFFPSHTPARTTIEVAALPADAQIEIDAIVAL